jgi:methionyl-tRNA formyltransferase
MKIIFCTSSEISIASIARLSQQHQIHLVLKEPVSGFFQGLLQNLPLQHSIVNDETWKTFQENIPDATYDVLVTFGFSNKIATTLISKCKHGGINVHFSLLPSYKGPAPLFWQIKNNESNTGISIHYLTDKVDGGAIIKQLPTSIIAGETPGMLSSRLSMMAPELLNNALQLLHTQTVDAIDQDDLPFNESYFSWPTPADLVINWKQQTAAEVLGIINAASTAYAGADTTLNGQHLKILEASMLKYTHKEADAGLIIQADNNSGLHVCTSDGNVISIDIVNTPQGIFSGKKLTSIGLQAGMRFS